MQNLSKFTEKEFKDRIDISYPNWDYEILEFTGYKNKISIKCNFCNEIINLKKADDLFNRVNFCKCRKIFKDFHEKIRYLGKQYDFLVLKEVPATQKQIIQCKKCGSQMERSSKSILKTPWHCDKCNNYAKGRIIYAKEDVQNELNLKFNNQYELLEYTGLTKSALLKHINCGMIFKIRELGDLFDGRNRGCPKCYKFQSRGEQEILSFLEQNQITYIPQKTFSPLNKSKYRFDFYIPEYNLAIEYQGEQHYRDNGFFKDDLKTIQKRDSIKKQYCLDNGIELLEIKYTELKHIQKILTSKFNDYRKLKNEQSSIK